MVKNSVVSRAVVQQVQIPRMEPDESPSRNSLIKLKGQENWALWKFQARINLQASDAFGHVDGTSPAPTEPAADAEARVLSNYQSQLSAWKLKDGKAQKFIANTLTPETMLHIMTCESAAEMWDTLKGTFESKTETSIHMLLQDWFRSSKDPADNMATHIAKIQDLAHRLKALGESISSSSIMTKILMTLPPTFAHFCTAWESTSVDERTLTNLISRLTMEEKRLGTQEKPEIVGALTSNAGSSTRGFRDVRGRGRGSRRKPGSCNYCGIRGHWEKECRTKLKELSDQQAGELRSTTMRSRGGSRSRGGALLSQAISLSVTASETLQDGWYLDSGATNHMTSNREWFTELRQLEEPIPISLGNGKRVLAVAEGNINVLAHNNQKWVSKHLKDVWYVPEIQFNLFSQGAALDKGLKETSTKTMCVFTRGGTIEAVGDRKSNLFRMRIRVVNGNSQEKIAKSTPKALVSSLKMWHERLAHQNYPHVKRILSSMQIKTSGDKEFCEPCVLGKIHRISHPPSSTKTSKIGELIHADLCGFMEVTSLGKARYFLLIKDDYSHFRYVFFLKSKNETTECFKNYILRMEKETEATINTLRTDQGLEFMNNEMKKLLVDRGIKHQKSVTYTPEQNGKVERDNRTVVEAARTMLYSSGLPITFWAEAVNTAVYTLNRTGTSTQKGTTPYELWHGAKANVSILRKFGTEVYVHIPKQRRRKWDRKAEKGIFVGYDEETKGYRIWLPHRRKVEVHCDVVFNERESTVPAETGEPGISPRNTRETVGVSEDFPDEEDLDNQNTPPAPEDHLQSDSEEDEFETVSETSDSLPNSPEKMNRSVEIPLEVEENLPRNPPQTPPTILIESSPERTPHTSEEAGYDLRPRKKRQQSGVPEDEQSGPDETMLLTMMDEPATYYDAQKNPNAAKWRAAMEEEMEALIKNETWRLVEKPKGANVLGNRWVYKVKEDPDGSTRFKARLVVKGCQQKAGLDYAETFSPVASFDSIRIILAQIAVSKMYTRQFDVKTAFLHGQLEDEVYMRQPEGFSDGTNKICRLQRSLYGLKQSPRCWNKQFVQCLEKFKMRCTSVEPCVFTTEDRDENQLVLAIYVDDGLIASRNKDRIEELLSYLEQQIEIKINPLSLFLGIQLERLPNGSIIAHQAYYTKRVIEKFKSSGASPVSIPADNHQNLSMYSTPEGNGERLNAPYREAVGSLLYLSMVTRPDIAFAVNAVSQHSVNPQKVHWNAVKRILKYLKGTTSYGILFDAESKFNRVESFSDADYASNVENRHSITGYILKLGGSPITWSSRKQRMVTQSTTESEFIAACHAMCKVVWVQNLMKDITDKMVNLPVLLIDNQSAIQWIKNGLYQSPKGKHIDVKYKFICEKFNNKEINVEYVRSKNQLADIFTKPLPKVAFENLRKLIGMVDSNIKSK